MMSAGEAGARLLRRGSPRAVVVLAAVVLAGCAAAPPDPTPASPLVVRPAPSRPPPVSHRGAAIAQHARLAAIAREAGDLADAAEHEEVLVLLAPDDPARAKALQATREAIRRAIRAQVDAAIAARRAGDLAGAREAYLRVLALDADNAEAAKALREIDLATMTRAQSDRAARVRVPDEAVTSAKARPNETNDLDQRIEIMRAGDLNTGLRELRSWVDAHPSERAARQRIGLAVAEKARELESKAQRETALGLYEQAGSLAGTAAPEWMARAQNLRKALGEQYYNDGMKVYRTDLNAAIRHFENGARYDPSNTNLQIKLREAKLAQEKLQKIGK